MASKRRKSEQGTRSAMSAYFARLEIKNIRCFGPLQILNLLNDSGAPALWTVILGPNSGGKSTLLQCLAGATLMRHKSHVSAVSKTRASELFFVDFRNKFRRDDTKNKGVVNGQFCHEHGNGVDSECFSKTDEGSFSISPTELVGQEASANWASNCFAYGVTRKSSRQGLSDSPNEKDGVASLFNLDASLINAEDWLLRLDYAEMRNASGSKALKTSVIKMLVGLLPLVKDIQIFEDDASLGVVGIKFLTAFGWVKIGQLGHGYQTMIGWVVDLAARMVDTYPDSNDPLSEAAIVLIDEIDLHMHPEWQRKIMGYLSERFPKVQFIATAHSPLIVQGADKNTNIVVLRHEGDHVVIDSNPENVRNWRVDQILASDLFGLEGQRAVDTDDFLAERRKILAKNRLTKKDRTRLKEIEGQVGYLPGDETAQDREAWDIVRRAADRLKNQGTAAE